MGDSINDKTVIRRFGRSRSKLGLLSVVLAVAAGVLVLAGVAYYLYSSSRHQADSDKSAAINKVAQFEEAPDSYNGAMGTMDVDQYNAAQRRLSDQAAQTKDAAKLSYIYMQQSTLAMSVQRYDEGLKYAKQSESAEPTVSSAQLIAENLRATGDKAGAIEYYKKAIERLDPHSELDQLDTKDYEKAIIELGGSV